MWGNLPPPELWFYHGKNWMEWDKTWIPGRFANRCWDEKYNIGQSIGQEVKLVQWGRKIGLLGSQCCLSIQP